MARKGRQDRGLYAVRRADGSTWWKVRLWDHGRRRQFGAFPTKTDARHFYEDAKRRQRLGQFFPDQYRAGAGAAFADVCTRYLAQATHKKNYRTELAFATFWQSWFKGQTTRQLTAERIEEARVHLLQVGNDRQLPRRSKMPVRVRPVSHATVNRYVAWLKHVLMIEERAGRIPLNPCRTVAKFTEKKPPEARFTEEEEDRVRQELGEQADYLTLPILTGLRQAEQFSLAWEWIDLKRGVGYLPDPKAGEPQVFIINEEAREIFRRLKQRSGDSPWVFPSPRAPAKHLSAKSWYRLHFKPACARAGIVLSRATGKTFHTLRHEFAGRLQDLGVEVKDIKDAGRWKSWQAMARYLKRDVRRITAQVAKLSRTGTKPAR